MNKAMQMGTASASNRKLNPSSEVIDALGHCKYPTAYDPRAGIVRAGR